MKVGGGCTWSFALGIAVTWGYYNIGKSEADRVVYTRIEQTSTGNSRAKPSPVLSRPSSVPEFMDTVKEEGHSLSKTERLLCLSAGFGSFQQQMSAVFKALEEENDPDLIASELERIKILLFSLYPYEGHGFDFTEVGAAFFQRYLTFSPADAEVHWHLANLWQSKDSYKAKYHALMAANDGRYTRQVDMLLDQLDNSSDSIVIPLRQHGRHFIASVELNDISIELILDTGASITSVSKDFIEDHPGLVSTERQPITLGTAGGNYVSYTFKVKRLTFADTEFVDHSVAVIDTAENAHYDGVLGLDILSNFDFFIDSETISLYLERH